MDPALRTPDALLLLAIQSPSTPHLCKQPSQRPQLCSTPNRQIRISQGHRFRTSRRHGRGFANLHFSTHRRPATRWLPMVPHSQHHRFIEQPSKLESSIEVPTRQQPFPTYERALQARGVAPHHSLGHWHRPDGSSTLVRKHENRISGCHVALRDTISVGEPLDRGHHLPPPHAPRSP